MHGNPVVGAMTSWMFWIMFKIGNLSTVAPQTYGFICHVALLMCMFSASVTADALSSEKRNGTLGLLFLTDLKGYDIVLYSGIMGPAGIPRDIVNRLNNELARMLRLVASWSFESIR